jgi:hypothetical protein
VRQGGGAADVFVRQASGWELEQHIQLPTTGGCASSAAPRTIALSGDGATLLLSQPDCEVSKDVGAGTVYSYERTGSTWSLSQTIPSPEPQFNNEFGSSMAISDDGSTATAGIGLNASGLPKSAGAAWVLTRSGGSWRAAVRLTAPSPEENGSFVCPAIIEDGAALVCGSKEPVGFNARQGAAYVVRRSAADWSSSTAQRLFATEGEAGDSLGLIGHLRWTAFATSSDGNLVDATISPANLATGLYPNDRIGYEFSTGGSPEPSVTAVEPDEGPEAGGGSVVIRGTHLYHVTSVQFGNTPARAFKVLSSAAVSAEAPAGTGSVDITVTSASGTSATSAADRYGYVPPPTVERLEPGEGATYGGTRVTITGTYLAGATAVKFGASAATGVKVESATSISAVSPRGSGTVDVVVTAAGGTSTAGPADHFVYANTPPEFGRCLKVSIGFGLYGDSGCKALGGEQKYEWFPAFGGEQPLVKRQFATHIKPATELKLESAGKALVACTGESSGGEFAGQKTIAGVSLVLTGCHRGEQGCQSSGAAAGEVQTAALQGTLGVIKTNATSPLKNQIGLDLEPQGLETIAEFSCAGTGIALRGGVIVPIPANAMSLTATLKFAALRGVQKPTHFEGRAPRVLEMKVGEGPFEQAGLSLTTIQTREEKVEASTVL